MIHYHAVWHSPEHVIFNKGTFLLISAEENDLSELPQSVTLRGGLSLLALVLQSSEINTCV